MGAVFIVADLNGNITGKRIQKHIALVHHLKGGLSGHLILLDLDIEFSDLAQDIVDFVHSALFTGACTGYTVKFRFFRLCDLGSGFVKKGRQILHLGTELALVDRIHYLRGIVYVRQYRLDILKRSVKAADIRLIQYIGQRIQGRLHGIIVIRLCHLKAVLGVKIGVPYLGYSVHADAETDYIF